MLACSVLMLLFSYIHSKKKLELHINANGLFPTW